MCTIGFKRNTNGTVLLFSTSDNPPDTTTHLEHVRHTDGITFISTVMMSEAVPAPPWQGMYSRGVNNHGLAYTYSYVAPEQNPPPEHQQFTTIAAGRSFLGECKTLADIEDVLQRDDRRFSGNFYFADSAGAVLYAELGLSTHSLLDLSNESFHGVTNHHILPASSNSQTPGPRSLGRLKTLQVFQERFTQLQDEATSVSELKELLGYSSTDDRNCSIASGTEKDPICVTTSAEIISPAKRMMYYCYGIPAAVDSECQTCEIQKNSWGAFKEFRLDDLPLGELVSKEGQTLE